MNRNKKKIAACDIETLPDLRISDEMVNLFCKTGNLKDEAKIKAKQAEFRSTMGMNPLLCIPCCCGYFADENNCGTIMLKDTSLEAEKAMLQEYWAKLAEFDLLISYNGISFDSKILLLRSVVHNIEIPFRIDRNKYKTTGNHIDLYTVLTDNAPFGQGKLDFFLSMFDLESKTKDIDGSMVADYYENGLFDEIAEYNLQDCRATLALFNKIKRYFL